MLPKIEAGSEVYIRARILDQTTDPPSLFSPATDVRILIARPDETIAVNYLTMTAVDTGVYEYLYQTSTVDMAGTWTGQIKTTDGSHVVYRPEVALFELVSTVPTGAVTSQDAGSAPASATYITQTHDTTLTAEQALADLATGYMKVTATTGIVSSQAIPIPATDGGTGLTTATQGDILYASASNTFSKLAKDTNATRYLSNTGSSNNPAWARVDLTNGVTGVLPAANGGVARTTVAADITHAQSSTVLSNITGLTVPVSSSATQILFFRAYLRLTAANTTSDWKFGMTVPASCTAEWGTAGGSATGLSFYGVGAGTSPPVLTTESGTVSLGSDAVSHAAQFQGWIIGGGTSGNVQLQFAQNTSDPSNNTVKKGSFIEYTEIIA